jgi:hypothetical protein
MSNTSHHCEIRSSNSGVAGPIVFGFRSMQFLHLQNQAVKEEEPWRKK